MNRKKYDEMILCKIERSLDAMIFLGYIVVLIGGIFVGLIDELNRLMYYGFILSAGLLMLFLFRRQIDRRVKLIVIAFSVYWLGLVTVFYSGFIGLGLPLLLLSCIIVVSFLSFKIGIAYSVFLFFNIAIIPLTLHLRIHTYINYNYQLSNITEWFIHIALFALFQVVIILIINSIKNYLVQAIIDKEIYMEKVYNLAYYDQLTNLPNKYRFLDILKENKVDKGILLLFNIKGLNLANSIYGFKLVNELLVNISDELRKDTKEGETCGRISDGIFAWYLTNDDIEEMHLRLRDIFSRITKAERRLGIFTMPKVYSGFVKMSNESTDIDTYYKCASIALEKAKTRANHTALQYDSTMEDDMRREERMKELLLQAIKEDEFNIYYQEKKDSISRQTIGVEALSRWDSPELGHLLPNEFLPTIEKINMIIPFGNYIVEKVFSEYKSVKKEFGENITISVNISPIHLVSPQFMDTILQLADKYDIQKSHIIIEITEETLIDNIDRAMDVVDRLRKIGFKISLDDFGTGYSSLSYLSMLGVDELKIDRSFVKQLGSDSKTNVLLQAIINLKHTYGFNVVAEGVETQTQCDILNDLGCNNIQGFLFSRPTPIQKNT